MVMVMVNGNGGSDAEPNKDYESINLPKELVKSLLHRKAMEISVDFADGAHRSWGANEIFNIQSSNPKPLRLVLKPLMWVEDDGPMFFSIGNTQKRRKIFIWKELINAKEGSEKNFIGMVYVDTNWVPVRISDEEEFRLTSDSRYSESLYEELGLTDDTVAAVQRRLRLVDD